MYSCFVTGNKEMSKIDSCFGHEVTYRRSHLRISSHETSHNNKITYLDFPFYKNFIFFLFIFQFVCLLDCDELVAAWLLTHRPSLSHSLHFVLCVLLSWLRISLICPLCLSPARFTHALQMHVALILCQKFGKCQNLFLLLSSFLGCLDMSVRARTCLHMSAHVSIQSPRLFSPACLFYSQLLLHIAAIDFLCHLLFLPMKRLLQLVPPALAAWAVSAASAVSGVRTITTVSLGDTIDVTPHSFQRWVTLSLFL